MEQKGGGKNNSGTYYGLGTALQMFTRSYNDSQGTFIKVEVYLHLAYMNFTGLQVIHKEFTLILVLKNFAVCLFLLVSFFSTAASKTATKAMQPL